MRYLFAILLCFIISAGFSQGSIKGKIMDSAAKSPLSLATVTVFKATDTALITYRLSTQDGNFKVAGIPLNKLCRAVISYSGFQVYRKEFTLTNDTPLDLGTISMTPVSESLEEVMVMAERPPVTVRRDTIEFNASSFKTLPTALVEDLLKKLPGVQVDGEGNIVANGKRVNRIIFYLVHPFFITGKIFSPISFLYPVISVFNCRKFHRSLLRIFHRSHCA
jgi:hypothetical protein